MLSHEVDGQGPPLLLIHGTMGSRRVWDPVREALARERRLILIDLPGMGDSEAIPGGPVPLDWMDAIGEVLDAVDAPRPAVVGHSMGAWTALELARARRVAGVLALTPAGLWEHSPRAATVNIRTGRTMARLTPPALVRLGFGFGPVRRIALRASSVDGGAVPAELAVALVADARRCTGFREHFPAVQAARFSGGADIDVPVRVAFGADDRITTPGAGQVETELPAHAVVEHWERCGHMPMWDQPQRVVDAALAVPTE
jgi:pimeloyl-ACP methyl ester carboxylesterase